jgi:hypothetical protein
LFGSGIRLFCKLFWDPQTRKTPATLHIQSRIATRTVLLFAASFGTAKYKPNKRELKGKPSPTQEHQKQKSEKTISFFFLGTDKSFSTRLD